MLNETQLALSDIINCLLCMLYIFIISVYYFRPSLEN